MTCDDLKAGYLRLSKEAKEILNGLDRFPRRDWDSFHKEIEKLKEELNRDKPLLEEVGDYKDCLYLYPPRLRSFLGEGNG